MNSSSEATAAPDAIKDLPGWVVWKLTPELKKPGKLLKKPFYTTGGPRGKHTTPEQQANDRAQLVDYYTAMAAARSGGYAGVGFAPRNEWGIVPVDFDDCVIDGKVDPQVERLLAGTYTEYSPSGGGIRSFVTGSVPPIKDTATEGRFGIETFHDSGYVTFTGNVLPSCWMLSYENTVAERSELLVEFIQERLRLRGTSGRGEDTAWDKLARESALRDVTAETVADLRSALLSLPQEMADEYNAWIKVGEALASLKETEFASEALEMWHEFSDLSTEYDADYAEMKWDGFHPSKITHRTIFQMAQASGWTNPRSAKGQKTGTPDDYAKLEDRTDVGNANLLARLTDGNLRYVQESRYWLEWDGARWLADSYQVAAHQAALGVGQHYHLSAHGLRKLAEDPAISTEEGARVNKVAESVEKWAAQCRGINRVRSMLDFASKDPRVTVSHAELDTDPWLFGVANGVVDLRTGTLRPAGRDEMVTRRSPLAFDPMAKAARWRQFIVEITGRPLPVAFNAEGTINEASVGRFEPRPALADYLQRTLGYWLTAGVSEQTIWFFIGAGANGKSVVLDTAKWVMGDYCRSIPAGALMVSAYAADSERPSPVAATLAGARLAISSESSEGQKLDVALIKLWTGGGSLTARFMRENSFTFLMTHKTVLQTNKRPALDHLDDAIRGRLHLVPFDRIWNRPGHTERNPTLPAGDKDLMDALREEGPGILAWMVEGAVRYAQQGLEPPPEVIAMTQTYLREQDPVARWADGYDRCDPKAGTPAADLFQQFNQWRLDEDAGVGSAPETSTAFGLVLSGRLGIPKQRVASQIRYGMVKKQVEDP